MFEPIVISTPTISIPHPNARILAKLEGFQSAGSVKDRIAKRILEDAGKKGLLRPGGTVIEATSGNTGIALASLCAAFGYRCIIVMPEDASRERIRRICAYGAQVVLTPEKEGMAGSVKLANRLHADIQGSFLADQFQNPSNPQAHFDTTGPEILPSGCDIFLAGVGSGGTITGVGRYLRQHLPGVHIVAVHPAPGEQIPGLGAGFVPGVFDERIVDESIFVTRQQAIASARHLAKTMGILTGFSGGAALYAAFLLADREENTGKIIATVLPDSGQNDLSSDLFS